MGIVNKNKIDFFFFWQELVRQIAKRLIYKLRFTESRMRCRKCVYQDLSKKYDCDFGRNALIGAWGESEILKIHIQLIIIEG